MDHENQRIMLTKRLLKEGLLRLLERKELEAITVTELCREAGINRATFYRHYEIPRDVLNEIGKDYFYEMRREVGFPNAKTEIKLTIQKLCNYMEKRMDIMRLIIKSSTETDFMSFVSALHMEMWNEIRSIGILSNMDDDMVQILILYSAGGSYFVLRHWLLGNIHKSSREMAAYLYELLSKADWGAACDQLGLLR